MMGQDNFSRRGFQMIRDMDAATRLLEEGNWTGAAKYVGRMCLTIERYRNNMGDSSGIYHSFDDIIIPRLVRRLIETA